MKKVANPESDSSDNSDSGSENEKRDKVDNRSSNKGGILQLLNIN